MPPRTPSNNQLINSPPQMTQNERDASIGASSRNSARLRKNRPHSVATATATASNTDLSPITSPPTFRHGVLQEEPSLPPQMDIAQGGSQPNFAVPSPGFGSQPPPPTPWRTVDGVEPRQSSYPLAQREAFSPPISAYEPAPIASPSQFPYDRQPIQPPVHPARGPLHPDIKMPATFAADSPSSAPWSQRDDSYYSSNSGADFPMLPLVSPPAYPATDSKPRRTEKSRERFRAIPSSPPIVPRNPDSSLPPAPSHVPADSLTFSAAPRSAGGPQTQDENIPQSLVAGPTVDVPSGIPRTMPDSSNAGQYNTSSISSQYRALPLVSRRLDIESMPSAPPAASEDTQEPPRRARHIEAESTHSNYPSSLSLLSLKRGLSMASDPSEAGPSDNTSLRKRLTSSQLELIQRLSQQNVQGQALTAVIESMLNDDQDENGSGSAAGLDLVRTLSTQDVQGPALTAVVESLVGTANEGGQSSRPSNGSKATATPQSHKSE